MSDTRPVQLARFEETVDSIRREFPQLKIDANRNHAHVHALTTIPAQPGLQFEVSINSQNCDELHLCASHLWLEWFPCGEQSNFDGFIQSVLGLLAGSY